MTADCSFFMNQKIKKKERKKLSPEAREKKDSSAKSLNDIKKSERKNASHWSFDHWSLVLNEYDKWLS